MYIAWIMLEDGKSPQHHLKAQCFSRMSVHLDIPVIFWFIYFYLTFASFAIKLIP